MYDGLFMNCTLMRITLTTVRKEILEALNSIATSLVTRMESFVICLLSFFIILYHCNFLFVSFFFLFFVSFFFY